MKNMSKEEFAYMLIRKMAVHVVKGRMTFEDISPKLQLYVALCLNKNGLQRFVPRVYQERLQAELGRSKKKPSEEKEEKDSESPVESGVSETDENVESV